jgi:methanesulfonate monooxygenase subunit beta
MQDLGAFISKSCRLLDEEDFEQWMELCAPKFNYRITTYSPDLDREMCWLDVDRAQLDALLGSLRTHVRVPGRFFRHPGSGYIEETADGRSRVVTPVSAFHTTPQGATSVFAVYRYHDQFDAVEGTVQLLDREVRLDTRLLEFAPHVVL